MEEVTPPLPETGSTKKAADDKPYLFLLAISFLVGAVSFIIFLDSNPASLPLGIISILLVAYALGLFSSIRLVRSVNSIFRAIGLCGLLIQSFVMLALFLLLVRTT